MNRLIYKLLCNEFTGKIIFFLFKNQVPNIRHAGNKFYVPESGIHRKILASIFWGFYENAEIRFIKKYFPGDCDAIELGASIGVISSFIARKFSAKGAKRAICIEANHLLADTWHKNMSSIDPDSSTKNAILVNGAIDYHEERVLFTVSSNTTESRTGGLSTGQTQQIEVPSIQLKTLIPAFQVHEYVLVCDIEGAEVQLFLYEDAVFSQCKAIIIELHHIVYQETAYTVSDLIRLIEQKGFILKDQYGSVCYFVNKAYLW